MDRRFGLALIWALCFFALPLGVTPTQAEQYLRVSGEAHLVVIDRYPREASAAMTTTNERTISFECIFGKNQFQLQGNFVRYGWSKWFFDGTNLFNSLRATEEPSAALKASSLRPFLASPEAMRSNLTVNVYSDPDGYLADGDVNENVLWLAFCSGSYLKRIGRIIPLPTAFTGHTPAAFGYRDKTESFKDELGLPHTVALITSQTLYAEAIRRYAKEAQWKSEPVIISNVPDGQVRFHYKALQSTNVCGWGLPLEFEFGDDTPEELGRFRRSIQGIGRVRTVSSAMAPAGVFDTNLNQFVIDWRFNHESRAVNAITYRWTNSFVAPTNDPMLLKNYAARVKRANEKGGHP